MGKEEKVKEEYPINHVHLKASITIPFTIASGLTLSGAKLKGIKMKLGEYGVECLYDGKKFMVPYSNILGVSIE